MVSVELRIMMFMQTGITPELQLFTKLENALAITA